MHSKGGQGIFDPYSEQLCKKVNLSEGSGTYIHNAPVGGYLVERWVRGMCCPDRVPFLVSQVYQWPLFYLKNWFRYMSHFCKMHNF